MFWMRNKKNNFLVRTLIWRPDSCFLFSQIDAMVVSNILKKENKHVKFKHVSDGQ